MTYIVSARKDFMALKICSKCGQNDWGEWTSSSTGKVNQYCRNCRKERARNYSKRKKEAKGSHTKSEWEKKRDQFDECPDCGSLWEDIPPRPDKRYTSVITKDHIVPLNQGGTDDITNIQPLCYRCNFGKR